MLAVLHAFDCFSFLNYCCAFRLKAKQCHLNQYLSLDDFYIYIMERSASFQDLHRLLQKRRLTAEKEARRYFKQIIEATISCEEIILLDMDSDEIKVIDFGLASKLQYEPSLQRVWR